MGREVRWSLAVLALAAGAPGCVLPAYEVDPSVDGRLRPLSGVGGSSNLGGQSSGGATTGVGGWHTGGALFGGGTPTTLPTGGTSPTESVFANNGYAVSGPWTGYVYTFTNGPTTITPLCDDTGLAPCFSQAGKEVCVSGSVPGSPTYENLAALGMNLNQRREQPNPTGTWVATGSGIAVQILNRGQGKLRIQIQTPASTAATRWCAIVPPGGGTIPWTSFNTTCWDNHGAYFVPGTAIQDISVIVPGGGPLEPAVNFDFCVVNLAPAP